MKKIITLDDDPDFNNLLKVQLKKLDFIVETTINCKEFSEKLKTFAADLFIIDLNLEEYEGAGFDMVAAIRRVKGYDVPILVFSRRSTREDIQKALEKGADDFIQKPYDQLTLVNKLSQFFPHLGGKDDFPFKSIATPKRPCTFEFDLELDEIFEDRILAISKSYIGRGSGLNLRGDLLFEIFGKEEVRLFVDECTRERESGPYCVIFKLDDESLSSAARNYILKKL